MNHSGAIGSKQQHIVLPVPSSRLSSSLPLHWKGLVVEAHRANPEPMEESTFPHYLIELATGNSPAFGERATRQGQFRTYCKLPGMMNLYTEGARPALRPTTHTNLVVGTLDRTFVSEVAHEMELSITPRLQGQLGMTDVATASLLSLLEAEAREGGAFGPAYSNHLIYSLTQRLLMLGTRRKPPTFTRWSLPKPRLARVIESMHSDLCASHDLEGLARESGYSRNHFIRMFRAATGFSPHQYLLDLRVKKAQVLLKESSMKLIDISAECGFSSQAQMSKVFHAVLGVSPRYYRQNTKVLFAKVVPLGK